MKKEDFEGYLERAEKIISQLEEGDLGLEETLKLYEEGVKILKKCYEILDAMEKKVEILTKDNKGKLQTKQFKGQADA